MTQVSACLAVLVAALCSLVGQAAERVVEVLPNCWSLPIAHSSCWRMLPAACLLTAALHSDYSKPLMIPTSTALPPVPRLLTPCRTLMHS